MRRIILGASPATIQNRNGGYLSRITQEIGEGSRELWTIPLASAGAVPLFLRVIAFYLLTDAGNKVYAKTFPVRAGTGL